MDLEPLRIDRTRAARPARRSRSRALRALVALAVVAALAWAFRAPLSAALDRLTLPAVEAVVAVRSNPLAATAFAGTSANGYVVAAVRAALSADAPGRIVELNVVEGSTVRRGDVIARLYAEEFEAALAQADAGLVAARAAADRARADIEAAKADAERLRAEVSAAGARGASAAADLRLADIELARAVELVKAGVDRERDLDQAVASQERAAAAALAAEAAAGAARAALAQGEAGLLVAEAAAAEADARTLVAAAARDQAAATLEKTIVRAPFDGVVVLKDAEVGEVVSPNALGTSSRGSIATLVDLASLEVQVDLPEDLLETVVPGTPAAIVLEAFPSTPYDGRVTRVWPTSNRQKAKIELRVGFDAPDARLRPELGARVVFSPREAGPALAADQVVVPESAVVRIDGAAGVFLLERDVARWRPVATGAARAGRVAVLSGLEGGELLVAAPPDELSDGDRVRVRGR